MDPYMESELRCAYWEGRYPLPPPQGLWRPAIISEDGTPLLPPDLRGE